MPDQFGNLTPDEIAAASASFGGGAPGPYASGYGAPPPDLTPDDIARAQASFDQSRAPTMSSQAPIAPPGPPPTELAPKPAAIPSYASLDRSAGLPPMTGAASSAPVSPAGRTTVSAGPDYARQIAEARGDVRKAQGEEKAAAGMNAEGQKQAATAEAAYYGATADMHQKLAAIDVDAHQQQQALTQAHLDKQAAFADALAKRQLDPMRVLRDQDTGTKFMSIMAAVLGGALQGMGKASSNPALDQMNRLVDTEMKRQQAELSNAKDVYAMKDNLYGQLRQSFGDDQLARNQFKVGMLESAKDKFNQQLAQTKDPQIQAQLQTFTAKLDEEIARENAAFAEHAQSQAQAAAAARANALRAQAKEERDYQIRVAELGLKSRGLDIEEGKAKATTGKGGELWVPTGPDGQGFVSQGKEEAAKEREAIQAAQELKSSIARIKELRAQIGMTGRAVGNAGDISGLPLQSKEYREIQSLGGELLTQFNASKHLGPYDKNNEALIKSIVGNPTSIFGAGDDHLDAIANETDRNLATYALKHGQNDRGSPSGYASGAPASFSANK